LRSFFGALVIASFKQQSLETGFGEVDSQRATAWTTTYNNVVVGII
jgi:hypothetical protein